jgi:hypothetical protein
MTVLIRLELAEKEIELIQDGGQIKREIVIYHDGPRPIRIICYLPEPPCFSLVTTFNSLNINSYFSLFRED